MARPRDSWKTKVRKFWANVQQGWPGKCWNWKACCQDGYGKFSYRQKPIRAHRFSYFLHYGTIPAGLMVLHECDNRKCVNPLHLFLGTNLDNMEDMVKKQRAGKLRFSDTDIRWIRKKFKKMRPKCASVNQTCSVIATMVGAHLHTIYLIVKRKRRERVA